MKIFLVFILFGLDGSVEVAGLTFTNELVHKQPGTTVLTCTVDEPDVSQIFLIQIKMLIANTVSHELGIVNYNGQTMHHLGIVDSRHGLQSTLPVSLSDRMTVEGSIDKVTPTNSRMTLTIDTDKVQCTDATVYECVVTYLTNNLISKINSDNGTLNVYGCCSNIPVIYRSQWEARQSKSTTPINVPVHMFFIHHTETPGCSSQADCSARVRSIQNYHMNSNGWSDIGYSFLVGEDGNVYEGRGWSYIGAHTQNYNSVAFGASIIGSFDSHIPNAKALAAVKGLIACGVQFGMIDGDYRLYGHRDAGQTSCPGNALYSEIQTWPHYSHSKP